MKKVKWQAKFDYEYVQNYKILQDAFNKNKIGKIIDVQRLVLARYQDNLEFIQWMKAYHGLHWNGEEYDAVGRRSNAQMHYILGGTKVSLPQKKYGGSGTTQPLVSQLGLAPNRPQTAQ